MSSRIYIRAWSFIVGEWGTYDVIEIRQLEVEMKPVIQRLGRCYHSSRTVDRQMRDPSSTYVRSYKTNSQAYPKPNSVNQSASQLLRSLRIGHR